MKELSNEKDGYPPSLPMLIGGWDLKRIGLNSIFSGRRVNGNEVFCDFIQWMKVNKQWSSSDKIPSEPTPLFPLNINIVITRSMIGLSYDREPGFLTILRYQEVY